MYGQHMHDLTVPMDSCQHCVAKSFALRSRQRDALHAGQLQTAEQSVAKAIKPANLLGRSEQRRHVQTPAQFVGLIRPPREPIATHFIQPDDIQFLKGPRRAIEVSASVASLAAMN